MFVIFVSKLSGQVHVDLRGSKDYWLAGEIVATLQQPQSTPNTWLGRWFRPRAINPEISFREQAIRVMFPLLLAFRLYFAVGYLFGLSGGSIIPITGIPNQVFGMGIILSMLAVYWALHTQRITLAGILMIVSWSTTDVMGAYIQGYWLPSVQLSFAANVVLGALVLRQDFTFPYTFFLMILYSLAALTGTNFANKYPLIEGQLFLPREWLAILVSAWMLIIATMMRFIKVQLNKRIERLRELVINLETIVEQRTSALRFAVEAERAARDEAERANRVKSAFLASMSHELRTPLNAVINLTTFVQNGVLGTVTPKQSSTLGQVVDSGKHLLSLINDVLDMSKIESGTLTLLIQDQIDVQKVLQPVHSTGKSLLGSKPVTLELDIPETLPPIRADKMRLTQILLNIVSNACKFTQEGSIRIRAWVEGDEICLSVTDTGPGIAPEDHALVFEPFKQTETGLRQAGGTGLGMPITQTLVTLHHGRIWLESEVGKGSTFYVVLPIRSEKLTVMMAF